MKEGRKTRKRKNERRGLLILQFVRTQSTHCQDLQGLTFRNFSTHSRDLPTIESKQHNSIKRRKARRAVGENKQRHKNHNFFLQFCRRSQLGSFIADFLPSPPSTNSSRLKYSVLWDQERKKSRLLTRGLISLRAFCPMINVLGTLGFTTICRQNFLKSLKKKVFFWATRIELKSSRLAFVDKD